jgi:branched-chain amino acid transport system substrate-binding protein
MIQRLIPLVGLSLALLAPLPAAAADIKVGMITSLSGPAASLGVPYAKGVRAGHAFRSEIGGHSVQLVILDDTSDPTVAARNAAKLIEDEKVDILIGAATVPATLAAAGVGREQKTPLIAISPASLSGEAGAWFVTVVQPAPLMIAAVVEQMKKAGVKTVAYIGFSDAAGDIFHDALVQNAKAAGIAVVANERYARADQSVTGQVLKIMALKPDAVLDGGTGTPGALPVLSLAERGYKGAVYGTHGVINPDFIRLVGASGEGLIAPTGPVIVAEQLPADSKLRKTAMDFRAAFERVHGAPPQDAFSAYGFDAWLVFADAAVRALSSAEPQTQAFRAALRDAIVSSREVVGTHGIYTFTPNSRYGVDERARVIVRLDRGAWKLLPP